MFIDVNCFTVCFSIRLVCIYQIQTYIKKSTVFKFFLTVILSPQLFRIWIICFLLRSISGPEEFRNMPTPSSRCKPTFSFLIIVLNRCRMYTPTNSQLKHHESILLGHQTLYYQIFSAKVLYC